MTTVPSGQVKTQRLFVAEIPAGAETKKREPPQVSLCPETKDWVGLFFHASEPCENCSFSDRAGTRMVTASRRATLLSVKTCIAHLARDIET